MKRLFFYLLFIASLILGYLYVSNHPPQNRLYADILPSNPIIFIESDNLNSAIKSFKNSWNQLDDRGYLYNLLFSRPKFQLLINSLPKFEWINFDDPLNNIEFISSIPLAVAKFPQNNTIISGENNIFNNFLIFTKLAYHAKLHILLVESMGLVSDRRILKYKGSKITEITYNGNNILYYFVIDNFVIYSDAKSLICSIIDFQLKNKVSIASASFFQDQYSQDNKSYRQGEDVYCHINLSLLLDSMAQHAANKPAYSHLPQSVSLFFQNQTQRMSWRLIARLAREHPDSLAHGGHLPLPQPVPFVPQQIEQAAFFFWTNWLHAEKLMDSVLAASSPELSDQFRLLADMVGPLSGKKLEDVLKSLGPQVGGMILRQTGNEQLNRSMTCLLLGVREPGLIKEMLQRMFARMQTVTVISHNTEIVSLVMAGGLLQPAYALNKGTLLLADSVQLLEQLLPQIDGLVEDGQHPVQSMPPHDNFLVSMHPKQMIELFSPVFTLFFGESRQWTKRFSPFVRDLLVQVVLPWMNRLHPDDILCLRGRLEGDLFRAELLLTTQ